MLRMAPWDGGYPGRGAHEKLESISPRLRIARFVSTCRLEFIRVSTLHTGKRRLRGRPDH